MLSVAEPCLGPEEKAALIEVIDSGWITMGERVRQFEHAFAAMHGAEDAVALGSGLGDLEMASAWRELLSTLAARQGNASALP